MTHDDDDLVSRSDLMNAAGHVETLLRENPDYSGQHVYRLLVEEAHELPEVPMPQEWHLIADEAQPTAFCGEFPGPDRERWHTGAAPEEMLQAFQRGERCCALCLLALAKIVENSATSF